MPRAKTRCQSPKLLLTLRPDVSLRDSRLGLTDCIVFFYVTVFLRSLCRGPITNRQMPYQNSDGRVPKLSFILRFECWDRTPIVNYHMSHSEDRVPKHCGLILRVLFTIHPVDNSGEESHTKTLWGHASVDVSMRSFAQLFVGRTAPISTSILTIDLRLHICPLIRKRITCISWCVGAEFCLNFCWSYHSKLYVCSNHRS